MSTQTTSATTHCADDGDRKSTQTTSFGKEPLSSVPAKTDDDGGDRKSTQTTSATTHDNGGDRKSTQTTSATTHDESTQTTSATTHDDGGDCKSTQTISVSSSEEFAAPYSSSPNVLLPGNSHDSAEVLEKSDNVSSCLLY